MQIKEFKENVINTIEYALESRVIKNYDLECSFDDVIEFYPSTEVENYKVINDKIDSEEISNIDIGARIDTLYDLIQAGLVEKV